MVIKLKSQHKNTWKREARETCVITHPHNTDATLSIYSTPIK